MAFSVSLGTRTSACLLAVSTALSAIAIPAVHAATPATSADLATTSDFLAHQLATGSSTANLLAGPTGHVDPGLTADYVFALDAMDTHRDQADASFTAIMDNLHPYLFFGGEVDANRLAKTVSLDSTRGTTRPDLVELLVDTVQSDGAIKNETDGEPTSAVVNFGQAWAVIALHQTGKTELARKAADYLAGQQCADGGVPLNQSVPPQCTSVDPDSTALAAQAFALVRGTGDSATRSAIEYLRTHQTSSGGLNSRFAGVNTNTTALAAGAFAAVGDVDRFAKAHRYLDSARFGASATADLRGGFAHQADTKNSLDGVNDPVLRTSGQAALAYAGGNYIGTPLMKNVPTQPPVTPTPEPPAAGDQGSAGGPVATAIGLIAAVVAVLAAMVGFMNFPLPAGR